MVAIQTHNIRVKEIVKKPQTNKPQKWELYLKNREKGEKHKLWQLNIES